MNFSKTRGQRKMGPLQEDAGRDRNSIGSWYVFVLGFTLGRSRGNTLCPGLRWGLSLVSGRWQLESKMPSGYLNHPWWPQLGFVIETIRSGNVKNQMCGGKE